MDTSGNKRSGFKSNGPSENSAHVSEAATELLNESKKLVNELYEDGCHKVCEAQDSVKEYSDELVKKVKENPLASILIAGGVGFLLSALLRK